MNNAATQPLTLSLVSPGTAPVFAIRACNALPFDRDFGMYEVFNTETGLATTRGYRLNIAVNIMTAANKP